jgi:DNA-directed RNA polymerase specialized sigma24 family protein
VKPELSAASDAELLERVAQLDMDALGEIYRRHAAGVFVLAHQLLGPAQAQEATHDVFVYVWDHANELLPMASNLRSVLLDQLRLRHLSARNGRSSSSEERDLTEQEQAALELALEGLSYKEAAARLGVRTGAVDELLRGALLKIYEVRTATTEDPRGA